MLRLVVLDADTEALGRLMAYVAPGRVERGDGGATYTATGTANVARGLGNLWPRLPAAARVRRAAVLEAAGAVEAGGRGARSTRAPGYADRGTPRPVGPVGGGGGHWRAGRADRGQDRVAAGLPSGPGKPSAPAMEPVAPLRRRRR